MLRPVAVDLSHPLIQIKIVGSAWVIKGPSGPLWLLYYEGNSVNRSQMEVKQLMGFPCVSLGSSTVQVTNAHAPVQKLVSEVKRRSCLGSVIPKSRVLLGFCGQNDSMQSIFIKKCVLFTVGSVRRLKRLQLGREILSRSFESRR
jgi:hypothetical protein